MNKSVKKLIAVLLALLVLVPAGLFAVPVVITWEWMMEDPEVTAFRYQVDGEDPAAWTVVDSGVTSYTVEGIEGSVTHSLYLQQSYDGENWSVSAISLVEPLVVEAVAEPVSEPSAPAVEPVVPDAPAAVAVEPVALEPAAAASVEPVAAPVAPAAEPEAIPEPEIMSEEESVEVVAPAAEPAAEPVAEPVVEPVAEPAPVVVAAPAPVSVPAPAKTASKPAYNEFSFGVDLSLGVGVGLDNWLAPIKGSDAYNATSPWMGSASLGFKFNNIVGFGNSFGVGVRADVGYTMLNTDWSSLIKFKFSDLMKSATHLVTVNLMPKLDIAFGSRAGMALEVGVEGIMSLPPLKIADASKTFSLDWGLAAGLQFDFMLNDWFSLGLNARYHYIFKYRQYVDARLVAGFHF